MILSNDIKSKCKLFADDLSLFFVVHDIDTSVNDLNHYLEKISGWVFDWKIKFNADPTKQAQEIMFSKKKTVSIYPVVNFDKIKPRQTQRQLIKILEWYLTLN